MKWQCNKICQFLVADIYHFLFPYSVFQKNETVETWHKWLLSNWRAWNLAPVLKVFKRFQKNIDLLLIHQFTKFGRLMSCGSQDIFKNGPCLMYQCASWRHIFDKSMDGWKYKNLNIFRTKHNLIYVVHLFGF